MWLEIKAVITSIGIFIFAIIIGISGNLVFALLGIMGIVTIMFGDILIGWKIVKTDAIHKLDPVDVGEKIVELHLIGGGERLLKAKKAPLGKYEFKFAGKKASILDDGSAPVRYPNGNPAIIAHESYDRNVNPVTCKYLEEKFKEYGVSNTEQLWDKLKDKEKKELTEIVKTDKIIPEELKNA